MLVLKPQQVCMLQGFLQLTCWCFLAAAQMLEASWVYHVAHTAAVVHFLPCCLPTCQDGDPIAGSVMLQARLQSCT